MAKKGLQYKLAFVFLILILAGTLTACAGGTATPTTPKPTTPTAPATSPTATPTIPKPTTSPSPSPSPTPTATAKPVTWRLASDFPLGTFVSDTEIKFMDEVTRRSNGLIKFDYFPGAALYKSTELWPALQDGRIEAIHSASEYGSSEVPVLGCIAIPITFLDEAHAQRAAEGDWGKELIRITEEHFTNIKVVGCGSMGAAYGVGKGNPILVPSDMKARKMRCSGKPQSLFFGSQGAIVITMSSSELSMAFERGTIDATVTTVSRIASQFKGIVDWVVLVPWTISPLDFIMVSRSAFNALAPELQKVVLEGGKAAQDWSLTAVTQRNKDDVEKARAMGMKIYPLTPEQLKQWFDVSEKYVLPELLKDWGAAGERLWALAQKYR